MIADLYTVWRSGSIILKFPTRKKRPGNTANTDVAFFHFAGLAAGAQVHLFHLPGLAVNAQINRFPHCVTPY